LDVFTAKKGINTGSKVFTRLISTRILRVAQRLICSIQNGFLPNRFIAKHGLSVQLAMMDSQLETNNTNIGLLINQEKAYDRINTTYLTAVLKKFKFPKHLITCIDHLFFSTTIRINVNSHLSQPVTQKRGLCQGDPLSPALFNLAFDPFL
jgi:hypothetical protein